MKRWLRKIMVAFVAIVTLGMYVPPVALTTDAEESKDLLSEKSNMGTEHAIDSTVEDGYKDTDYPETAEYDLARIAPISSKEASIGVLTEQAKEQAFLKFGPRMLEKIEDEFTVYILPVMEEVLETVLESASDDEVAYYAITEEPARGLGERIFHVYDKRNKKDVLRFHVRRENRPLEGYWFNFHYHLREDNFEKHHEIGDIYWDKNIPPKWMSS